MEQRKVVKTNNNALPSLILGVCIIIAALIVGANIKSVSKTLSEKIFAYNPPSSLSVDSEIPSQYFTQDEAAAYLKMSSNDVLAMITNQQIKKYVKAADGSYILSKEVLDEWYKTYSAVTE